MEVVGGMPDPESQRNPDSRTREKLEETVREAKEKFGRAVSQTRQVVEERAKQAREAVGEKARQARAAVEEQARQAQQKASELYGRVQGKTLDELIEDGRVYVRNNPMKSIGVALLVGMVAGRLLRRR
jgi:ElaB/YqjD/DUF883 family membrane-anchored ribosome-binding protein